MEVAILVHCYGLTRAGANLGFGLALVREVNADATILILQIDEGNVMLLGHGMRHGTHLYLDTTIAQTSHHGEMLFDAGVNGIHGKLLHLLATTYDGNLRVNHFLDYITTMLTFEQFYCQQGLLSIS